MADVRVCVLLLPPDPTTQQTLMWCRNVPDTLPLHEVFNRAGFWLATQISQADYNKEVLDVGDYTPVLEPSLGYEGE